MEDKKIIIWSGGETATATATTALALPLCHDFTPCLYLARDSNSLKSFPKNERGFINLREAPSGRATVHQMRLKLEKLAVQVVQVLELKMSC